jgi:DNA-binding LacI/PurR family transcriptional regulator
MMSLETVAKRARVSTATVSRVLNGVDVVKTSTRARVIKAIADLKYHPNLHARSLAGAVNKTIGVVVSNLDNPFFLDVYRAVESDCHSEGYEVVVANTLYRPEQLAASVRTMIGRRVAGLALIVSEMDDEIVQELTEGQTPVVLYDVGAAGGHVTKIRVNYRRGVERIVDYLSSLGHKHFGFIGHHSGLAPLSERCNAVLESVKVTDSRATVRQALDTDSLQGGRRAAAELLSSGELPTAIICVNDLMAVGALLELRERGLQVPRDISVTGFDDIELAKYCYPALTTVNIPRDQVGHTVFRSLAVGGGAREALGREFSINPELVVRESTGAARRSAMVLAQG